MACRGGVDLLRHHMARLQLPALVCWIPPLQIYDLMVHCNTRWSYLFLPQVWRRFARNHDKMVSPPPTSGGVYDDALGPWASADSPMETQEHGTATSIDIQRSMRFRAGCQQFYLGQCSAAEVSQRVNARPNICSVAFTIMRFEFNNPI